MTDNAKPEVPIDPKIPKRIENWAEDQQARGYYYDDAHGYEKYDPEEEEEERESSEDDLSA
jgi:hypothetical protein